jgi:hypothetical protein
MKFGRFSTIAILCMAGALAASLYGCGSSNSLGPGANTIAYYRAFNGLVVSGAPSGGPIDIALRTPSSQRVVTGLAEGTASSYAQTPAGNGVNVYAFENGAVAQSLSGSADLQPNTYYSLMVIGVYQSNGTVLNGQIVRLTDTTPTSQLQNSAGTATQYAAIRIFNGIPNGPTISITNDTTGTPADIPGFDGIAPATASGNANTNGLTGGYLVLQAGTTYTFTVHNGGNTGQALLTIPNVTPTAGTAYTIVITGSSLSADNVPISAKVLVDPLH